MIHPLVVQESLTNRFCYWNESLQEGIHFNNDLYTHFQSFKVSNRLRAYSVAYEQIEQGNTVCITASKTHYTIWLCLRVKDQLTSVDEIEKISLEDKTEQEKILSSYQTTHR